MPLSLFEELVARVRELESHLLPTHKDDLTYSRAEYDRVRAYVLLVHAEVEAYMEQRVLDEVTRRMSAWKSSRTPSVTLMGILAFCPEEWVGPIESLDAPDSGDKNPTWSQRDLP